MSLPGVDHEPALFLWMLLQYLWQGCLLAALAFIADTPWLRASHRVRYRLLESCTVLFWLLPCWLLCMGLWKLHFYLRGNAMGSANPSLDSTLTRLFESGLLAHALLLAVIWLTGAALLMLRLVTSWLRLHTVELASASESLSGLVVKTGKAAGMTKLPSVYEAGVAAPLVFGAMKPRLVVPQGLPSLLQQDEIEALLLHELAHVKRKDYLRNLVHHAFACVFWFHPASWVLLRRLAKRRELCCDADAVQSCSSATLGRALVKLLEGVRPSYRATVEVSSIAGAMETRLLALLKQNGKQEPLNILQVGVLAVLFALTVAVTVRPSQTELLRLAQDPQMLVQARDDAGPFELRIKHGMVLNATFGAEKISGKSIVQRGTAVLIQGRAGEAPLSLTVDSSGNVRWQSRPRR